MTGPRLDRARLDLLRDQLRQEYLERRGKANAIAATPVANNEAAA